MQTFSTTILRVRDNQLWILDQQALPQQQRWHLAENVAQLVYHIRMLRVRGAPLIGLAASVLMALLAESGQSRTRLERDLAILRTARPTAVNLMNNLARMAQALTQPDFVSAMGQEALRLVAEDRALCDAIARHGAALGVIALAHRQGNIDQVWVDETRPLLQGGRLTAWDLGIPYRLICDGMAADLMARGQVNAVWVGADRIAANGDVANKIGTYSLAVLARWHGVPFYVAAPHTTCDARCPSGESIPI